MGQNRNYPACDGKFEAHCVFSGVVRQAQSNLTFVLPTARVKFIHIAHGESRETGFSNRNRTKANYPLETNSMNLSERPARI